MRYIVFCLLMFLCGCSLFSISEDEKYIQGKFGLYCPIHNKTVSFYADISQCALEHIHISNIEPKNCREYVLCWSNDFKKKMYIGKEHNRPLCVYYFQRLQNMSSSFLQSQEARFVFSQEFANKKSVVLTLPLFGITRDEKDFKKHEISSLKFLFFLILSKQRFKMQVHNNKMMLYSIEDAIKSFAFAGKIKRRLKLRAKSLIKKILTLNIYLLICDKLLKTQNHIQPSIPNLSPKRKFF